MTAILALLSGDTATSVAALVVSDHPFGKVTVAPEGVCSTVSTVRTCEEAADCGPSAMAAVAAPDISNIAKVKGAANLAPAPCLANFVIMVVRLSHQTWRSDR
jgi:hypothetical protein